MKDIVEAALNDRGGEHDVDEDTDLPDGSTDEFGELTFAVLGCGEDGISWLSDGFKFRPRVGMFDTQIDFDTTTIAVGSPAVVSAASDVDEVISVSSLGASGDPVNESRLSFEDGSKTFETFEKFDVVVVLGNASRAGDTVLMERVCRTLTDDTLTIGVPLVFSDVLSQMETSAFRRLVTSVDSTIPLEWSRIRPIFGGKSDTADSSDSNDQTLIVSTLTDLTRDIFELFHVPIEAPPNIVKVRSLLDSGGVTLVHRGLGTRDDVPGELVEDAEEHRLSSGDTSTADGVLGLFRFGAPFTLGEFQTVEDYLDSNYRPTHEDAICQLGGMVTRGFGEHCRLTLLFSGVDIDSVSFVRRS
ncbi:MULTISPECIES: hypothetical protein [Haloferax]|uniref:Tubulin/FtsZ GTPase n=1 Tax=Haloferax marinum TaxID=2666143 RepID=A0A6A8GDT5_9EURY|nr:MULTISPECIES: hypothetical protein [Haloferax]KAB1190764.1 hypothetical protein Hfx1150_17180 [Haloferax sp. CBA1150]MRW98303.1 hypothetical protein [Haloferax marinum]